MKMPKGLVGAILAQALVRRLGLREAIVEYLIPGAGVAVALKISMLARNPQVKSREN